MPLYFTSVNFFGWLKYILTEDAEADGHIRKDWNTWSNLYPKIVSGSAKGKGPGTFTDPLPYWAIAGMEVHILEEEEKWSGSEWGRR